jgi:hypothetical protein
MSHASATSRTLNKRASRLSSDTREASWTFIVPSAAREKIEARSKRKPSTPTVRAQKRRLSSTRTRALG